MCSFLWVSCPTHTHTHILWAECRVCICWIRYDRLCYVICHCLSVLLSSPCGDHYQKWKSCRFPIILTPTKSVIHYVLVDIRGVPRKCCYNTSVCIYMTNDIYFQKLSLQQPEGLFWIGISQLHCVICQQRYSNSDVLLSI